MKYHLYLFLFLTVGIHQMNIPLSAQSQPVKPWWPHPQWGAGDQAGASNWNG